MPGRNKDQNKLGMEGDAGGSGGALVLDFEAVIEGRINRKHYNRMEGLNAEETIVL